jgi:hypothetical protein
MAEPLTSSDIIKLEKGFGPSSDDERRRRFAAGESPVSRSDFARIAEGRGISSMASKSEKDAWVATEVMSGRRDPMELPESYGGLGDRPEATTRRGLRMQQEWDKQRETMIQEQEMARRAKLDADQFDLQVRQENRLLSDQDARRNAERLKVKMDEKNATTRSKAFGIMADADLNSPLAYTSVVEQLSEIAGALEDEDVRSALGVIQKASDSSLGSLARTEQKESENKYVDDMQKLMETGVTQEELPQYYDPDSPIGRPQFDPRKVAARVGGTKAQERAEAKTTKEETPKEKIGLDLQQAYGELNALLLSGQDEVAAGSKVAGLRARYKAATGEEAPEVPFQPKSKKEYDRVPFGKPYIGQDGKTRIKQ